MIVSYLSGSSVAKTLAGGAVLLVVACGVLAFSSDSATAGDWEKVVWGIVYEGDTSHPAQGATVVCKILKPDDSLRYQYPIPFTTESDGRYDFTIPYNQWELGDTIEVTATKGTAQKAEEKVITESGFVAPEEIINIILPTAIPQLVGTFGVFITIGVVGIVAVVALRKDRPRP